LIGRHAYQAPEPSSNCSDYDQIFVRRVHELIAAGHDRLKPEDYATAEEPHITGDLAEQVEEVLRSAREPWMRFFRVYDDPPVNPPKGDKNRRRGKHRRRVDIHINSSERARSPYTSFAFESKRLGPRHGATAYLGKEGLGCFLSAQYASEDTRAGMLGYVQSGDEAAWAADLESKMAAPSAELAISKGGEWTPVVLCEGLPHSYASTHGRGKGRRRITIYHSLLRFR